MGITLCQNPPELLEKAYVEGRNTREHRRACREDLSQANKKIERLDLNSLLVV